MALSVGLFFRVLIGWRGRRWAAPEEQAPWLRKLHREAPELLVRAGLQLAFAFAFGVARVVGWKRSCVRGSRSRR